MTDDDLRILRNRTFDELAVGDTARIERTLTADDVALFAVLSGDAGPQPPGDAGDAAEDDTWVKIYTTADCSGPVAGAGLDTMLEGAGIQVTVAPDSTTTFYATQSDTYGYTSSCSTPGLTYQRPRTARGPLVNGWSSRKPSAS